MPGKLLHSSRLSIRTIKLDALVTNFDTIVRLFAHIVHFPYFRVLQLTKIIFIFTRRKQKHFFMYLYKIVIVDDDELSLENLSTALSNQPDFLPEAVARNARQGKKQIMETRPDLLFLDVELPDMTGMELLQEIRDDVTWPMKVVFYTAYDKYMIQAIRESAFDYLLKPFDDEELNNILERFRQQQKRLTTQPEMRNIAHIPAGQSFMVFTPTNDMRVLRSAEIGFFRYCSDRKIWEVIFTHEAPLTLRRGITADQITSNLPNFIQIHQSYIINIDYLMLIKDNHCVMYPPFDQVTELLVSKKYKKKLQERFCL